MPGQASACMNVFDVGSYYLKKNYFFRRARPGGVVILLLYGIGEEFFIYR